MSVTKSEGVEGVGCQHMTGSAACHRSLIPSDFFFFSSSRVDLMLGNISAATLVHVFGKLTGLLVPKDVD